MSNNNYKIKYIKYKQKYLKLTNNIKGGTNSTSTSESKYIELISEELDKMFEIYVPKREINICEKNFFDQINNLKLKEGTFESKYNSLKYDIIEILKVCKKGENLNNGFIKYQDLPWQYLFLTLANRKKMEQFITEKLKIRNIDESFFFSDSNPFFNTLKILSGKPYGNGGPFQYINEEATVKESFITALFTIRNNSGTHLANEIPPNDTEIINIRKIINDYLKLSPEQILDTIKKGINKTYNEWLFTIEVDPKTQKENKFPKEKPLILLNSKLLILIARDKDNTTQPFSIKDRKLNGISIATLRKALRSQRYKEVIKNLKYIDFDNKGYVIDINKISENGIFNKKDILLSDLSEKKYNNNGNSYSQDIIGTVFVKSSSKKVKPVFSKPKDWQWDLEQNTFKEIGYTKQNYNELLKSPLKGFEILIKELYEAKNYFIEIDKLGNNSDEILKKNKDQSRLDTIERIKKDGENIVCEELFNNKKEKIKLIMKQEIESELKELFKKDKEDEIIQIGQEKDKIITELKIKSKQEKQDEINKLGIAYEQNKQNEIDKLKLIYNQEKVIYETEKLNEINKYKEEAIQEREIHKTEKLNEITKCQEEKKILEKMKQEEIINLKMKFEQEKANNIIRINNKSEEVGKINNLQKETIDSDKESAFIQSRINIEKANKERLKREGEGHVMKQVGDSAIEAAAKAGKIRDEIAIADTAAADTSEETVEEDSKESYIYRKYKIIKLFENLKK